MEEERYSALWVLAPLCGTLVALTGGMLFRGWFIRDMGLVPHHPIFVGAFVVSVLITIAIILGYLGVLKRKIRPAILWFSFTGVLCFFFSGLTIICLVVGFSGDRQFFILGAFLSVLALTSGVALKRRLARP